MFCDATTVYVRVPPSPPPPAPPPAPPFPPPPHHHCRRRRPTFFSADFGARLLLKKTTVSRQGIKEDFDAHGPENLFTEVLAGPALQCPLDVEDRP